MESKLLRALEAILSTLNKEYKELMRYSMNLELILEKLYLDYFNNFVSISKFASYYNISEELASMLIKQGREIHYLKHGLKAS